MRDTVDFETIGSSKVYASAASTSRTNSPRSTTRARALPAGASAPCLSPRAGSRSRARRRCAGAGRSNSSGPAVVFTVTRSRCDARSARRGVRSARGRGSRSTRPRAPAAGSAGRRAADHLDRIVPINRRRSGRARGGAARSGLCSPSGRTSSSATRSTRRLRPIHFPRLTGRRPSAGG
jgi:hypothetical protein